MKTAAFIAALLIAPAAFGQWAVTDPILTGNVITMNANQLAQWATAIKKYEDQILNQLKALEEAKKLFDLQNTISARIGDWQGVLDRAKAIQLSADNLTRDYGFKWRDAVLVDYGQPSLYYTANGNYSTVLSTSRSGTTVDVNEQQLRRFKAVENLYDNVNKTDDETDADRKKILAEIAATADQIAHAPTQAETEKLFAKLEGLKAALANVQANREEKIQRMLAERALNENQKEKEDLMRAAVLKKNTDEEMTALGKSKLGGHSFR